MRTFLQPWKLRFVSSPSQLPADEETIAVTWGLRIPFGRFSPNVRVWRVEDGFLRSVGLGADLTTPLSWVLDPIGIYYDASLPSELERHLSMHAFSPAERSRGRALRERTVSAGITKYNVGGKPWSRPAGASRVILVPGQVEADDSIRCGTNRFKTNAALLSEVRRREPTAWIVYKPHPDVVAGLRRRGVSEPHSATDCDEVVTEADMSHMLSQVDEVHTMTSLTGFEALMRGRKVVTYGMPFYAGWGLTEDRDFFEPAAARRGRRLDLDELVFACLVLYPLYASRSGCLLEGPEEALAELAEWRGEGKTTTSPLRLLLRAAAAIRPRSSPESTSATAAQQPASEASAMRGRKFLFLQGPASPFFGTLAADLRHSGAEVVRVNFRTGDKLWWRGPNIDYRGPLEDLPGFYEQLFCRDRFTDVVLFGDMRPVHLPVHPVAAKHRAKVHVFEEGYIRPDWIALEREGVNLNSPLPRDPDWYREAARAVPPQPEASPVSVPLALRLAQDLAYRLSGAMDWIFFPHYRTHRPRRALSEYAGWCLRYAKFPFVARTEKQKLRELASSGRKVFLLPLQLNGDSQILHHSGFRSVGEVIGQVIASFAEHSPLDAVLVVKNHPFDPGWDRHGRATRKEACRHRVADRVVFIDAVGLQLVLPLASGVVVVNSTTGLSAIWRGIPVHSLANPVYKMPGLTDMGPLAGFWTSPHFPDTELFNSFRRVLLYANHANGDYFTTRGIGLAVKGTRRLLAAKSLLEELLERIPSPGTAAVPAMSPAKRAPAEC